MARTCVSWAIKVKRQVSKMCNCISYSYNQTDSGAIPWVLAHWTRLNLEDKMSSNSLLLTVESAVLFSGKRNLWKEIRKPQNWPKHTPGPLQWRTTAGHRQHCPQHPSWVLYFAAPGCLRFHFLQKKILIMPPFFIVNCFLIKVPLGGLNGGDLVTYQYPKLWGQPKGVDFFLRPWELIRQKIHQI